MFNIQLVSQTEIVMIHRCTKHLITNHTFQMDQSHKTMNHIAKKNQNIKIRIAQVDRLKFEMKTFLHHRRRRPRQHNTHQNGLLNRKNTKTRTTIIQVNRIFSFFLQNSILITFFIFNYLGFNRSSEDTFELLRNTDKTMYLNSDKAKTCPFCQKTYKRYMVSHIKSHHEGCEVYVSRISSAMVDKLKNSNMPVIKYTKNKSQQYVKAFCLFCEQERDSIPHYWNDHLRSHTGEYANECVICTKKVCFYSHCGVTASKKNDFNLYANNLYGYLCKLCNFLQLEEENMRRHLRCQHKLKPSNYQPNFEKITLLPALNQLKLFTNPNETQSNGK